MRLGDQRGLSLVELLVGMTLSFGVLGAALTSFNSLYQAEHDNDARNDTAEMARGALDIQTRQLRNIAKRVAGPVIDTASAYDLVFQTADPSRTWVRYCLDTTTAPASSDRGRLWAGELAVASASTPAVVSAAMRSGCPGSAWTSTRVIADHVTNRRAGQQRPLFSYTCMSGTLCTSTAATYEQIVNIAVQTLVDTTPGTGPTELRVASGVQLRNQNQAPVASFVSTPDSTSRTVVFNAAGSSDFEGRALSYYWFEHVMPATAGIDCAHPAATGNGATRTLWGAAGYIGGGIALRHTFAAADGAAGTMRPIGLIVCDPGDRHGGAGVAPQPAIAVQIPA